MKKVELTNRDKIYVTMVAKIMGLKEEDLFKETKTHKFVKFKQFVAFILRVHLDYSFPVCGYKLNVTHPTIIHSVKEIYKLDTINFPPYNKYWTEIKANLIHYPEHIPYLTWNYCKINIY